MTDSANLEDYLELSEGSQLEFKRPDALKDIRCIPREICAFLNSTGGGTIVVGIAEGRDGCLRIDPIDDYDEAKGKLIDQLVALLAPSTAGLFSISRLACTQGGSGLKIEVEPSGRLHVVRESNGRFSAYARIEDRTVPLEWEDIGRRMGEASPRGLRGEEREDLLEWFRGRKQEILKEIPSLRSEGALFLALRLNTNGGERSRMNLSTLRNQLNRWIINPGELGVRRSGWHFSTLHCQASRKGRSILRAGDESRGYRLLEISSSLELFFTTRLEGEILLPQETYGDRFGHAGFHGRSYRPISPRPLLETIASCGSLYAAILEGRSPGGTVCGCLNLCGVRGAQMGQAWMGQGNKDPEFWAHEDRYPDRETRLLNAEKETEEFTKAPHGLIHAMAIQLYDDFLLTPGDVPFYDAARGQFDFDRAG